jgi:hypothetical protein
VTAAVRFVLVAGSVKRADRIGHHDYRAGCRLAAFLLAQTAGTHVTVVDDGWPENEDILESARSLVFYTGGLDKHAFLRSTHRIERLQLAIDRGVGIVMLHQAVRYPQALAARVTSWIGGVHVDGRSHRGHWPTHHTAFPPHPVTSGVQPWRIQDGWLNHIQFVDDMHGVTPLVWSSREHGGSPAGGAADIVSWTYDRPDGGRSFCFTGLDAHVAWSVPGVRQLVVNGILWSAGVLVPAGGAPCAADDETVSGYLTPRTAKPRRPLQALWRRFRRPLR